MVRSGITKTRLLLLSSCREAKRAIGRQFSNLRTEIEAQNLPEDQEIRVSHRNNHDMIIEKESSTTSYWTPHPRTGIYVPKGHEHVVDDVPKNSATFDETYWLRSVDGVEKAEHDFPSDNYYFNTSL